MGARAAGIPWGVWFEPVQPVARLVELARLAESLGATTCLVADEGTERDVYVALTAILTATDHMVVGPAITNPFSRHPVTTAAAIATLAELAPGRVLHGLGVGGSRVLGPLGADPARPYTALRETLDVNRALLGGHAVGDARIGWFDQPVPIAIAGRGPRVQRLGAESADRVILSAKAVDELAATAADIRARGSAGIIWSSYLAYDDERARVKPHFTYMAVDAPPDIRTRVGLDDDTAAAIRELVVAGATHEAAELIPDGMVDVYAISGSPDDCARTIAANRAHFDLFALPMNDTSRCEDHIRRSAEILDAAARQADLAP